MSKMWRWIAPRAVAGRSWPVLSWPTLGSRLRRPVRLSYNVTIGARGTASGSVKGKVAGKALVAYKAAKPRPWLHQRYRHRQPGGRRRLPAGQAVQGHRFAATGQQVTLAAAQHRQLQLHPCSPRSRPATRSRSRPRRPPGAPWTLPPARRACTSRPAGTATSRTRSAPRPSAVWRTPPRLVVSSQKGEKPQSSVVPSCSTGMYRRFEDAVANLPVGARLDRRTTPTKNPLVGSVLPTIFRTRRTVWFTARAM